MGRNFIAMPLLLKLLTVATVAVPIFCIQSLLPQQSINVFGQHMNATVWWSSGAGLATLVASCFMLVASLLMLKRSHYGRLVYVLGWVAMSLFIPLIAYLVKVELTVALPSLISNLVLSAFIGLYLYRSSEIQNYFTN